MPSKEQMKQVIMDMVADEKKDFAVKLAAYKDLAAPTEEEYATLNAAWIASLKRIKQCYDDNNGSDSLFLKNTLSPLFKLLDEATEGEANQAEQAEAATTLEYKEKPLEPHQMRVYVVLYQAGGNEISKWVVQLLSLSKLLATRPVYLNEDDARQASKLGNDTATKGYVSLVVSKDMVINDELAQRRKDAAGRPLILLKDAAVDQGGEIECLVLGRERYRWLSNQLLPMFA